MGFEPTVGLTLRRFSRPVQSATLPPLLESVRTPRLFLPMSGSSAAWVGMLKWKRQRVNKLAHWTRHDFSSLLALTGPSHLMLWQKGPGRRRSRRSCRRRRRTQVTTDHTDHTEERRRRRTVRKARMNAGDGGPCERRGRTEVTRFNTVQGCPALLVLMFLALRSENNGSRRSRS